MAGSQPISLKCHDPPQFTEKKKSIFMDHQKMEAPNSAIPKVAETTPTVALTRAILSQRAGGGGTLDAVRWHYPEQQDWPGSTVEHPALFCLCDRGSGRQGRPSMHYPWPPVLLWHPVTCIHGPPHTRTHLHPHANATEKTPWHPTGPGAQHPMQHSGGANTKCRLHNTALRSWVSGAGGHYRVRTLDKQNKKRRGGGGFLLS